MIDPASSYNFLSPVGLPSNDSMEDDRVRPWKLFAYSVGIYLYRVKLVWLVLARGQRSVKLTKMLPSW